MSAVLLIIPILVLFSVPSGLAESEAPEKIRFADFDGDGINDNAPDEDGDGIPDNADPDYIVVDAGKLGFINFQAGLGTSAINDALLTNYDRFGKRKFCARALGEDRCGFTSDEGFGGDIGIGLSSGGGACAGGVCR